MSALTATLADRVVMMHNGGWDEMAMFTGPVAIIALLVYLARRQSPGDEEDDEQEWEDPAA